ncbi:hypothetical protein FAM09_25140 [Niastella caeni]|uniref:KAP NTPase domain-containing protein n=1 Tax=Niastella caeni TaxID=2569763 RepID=A0A4S8HEF2_9BACT|nr:P-loop NTPase fold protein [Niastella caeni]THU33438.1 hypothetical protein FAM09_25140 [Niastella caeni]
MATDNNSILEKIASMLDVEANVLGDLLDKEFEIISADPVESKKYPSTKEAFFGYALRKIDEITVNEKNNSYLNDGEYLQVYKRMIRSDEQRKFYFSVNELEALRRIWDFIDDYTNYFHLNLDKLELVTLPPLLLRISNLQSLNISNNKLRDISMVGSFIDLQVLIADANEITSIEFLKQNKNLQILRLNQNSFISTYEVIKNMPVLREVELVGNQINDTGARTILKNPRLEKIMLVENPINAPLDILNDLVKLRAHFGINLSTQANVTATTNADDPPASQTTNEQPEEQYISYAIRDIRLRGNPDKNLLDIEKLSGIFYNLIANSDSNGEHFFGLFGRWGRGKTFFWKYILKNNLDKEKYIPIEFHAWRYQETPGIWAYLYNTLNDAYLGDKPKWYQLTRWVKYYKKLINLNDQRGKLSVIVGFLLSIVIAIGVYLFSDFIKADETVKTILGWGIPISIITMLVYIAKTFRTDARKIILSVTSNVNFNSQLGFQHEIQQELKYLLQAWIPEKLKFKKRIFLFIDDIDRCSEDKIIQIVDYIRVLLHCSEIQDRVTVLAAIDERILLHAIQDKYKDFIANKDNDATYKELCREYMDKLFLAGLKLGPLTEFEKRQIVEGFTSADTAIADVVMPPATNGFNSARVAEVISKTESEEQILANSETVTTPSNVKVTIPESDIHTVVLESKNISQVQTEIAAISAIPVTPKPIDSTARKEFPYEKWEQEFIKDILARNTESTPRSIRVYTYRYLLGKQLVEKSLAEGKTSWLQWYNTKEAKQCFAIKLLHYGFKSDTEHLLSDYRNFIKDYDEDRAVKESIYGYEISLNQELGSIMFQVLTMIIAY